MASGSLTFVLGFALVAVHHLAAAQTVHVVGDATGWTVPQRDFYSTWATNKKFTVGDSLVFNFMTNSHDVLQVSKESFDACNSDNSIGELLTTGPAKVTLNSTGVHYYICTVGQHCLRGQKLSVTVSPASNSPRPPTGNPPSTAALPPKGSPDAACAPDGSPVAGGGPQVISPPRSSAQGVAATLSAALFGIVLSLF